MHTPIQKGTRILMACVPADGHFNPLTGIAVYLQSIGCDVRWYTAKKYEEKIRKMGIHFYGLKKAMDIAASSNPDDIFPDRKLQKSQVAKLKYDMINVFIKRGPEYYEDIKEIYQEFAFDIMIADITFGGIVFVKEKMRIPVVGVNIIPNPESSKDLPPPGLGMTPSYSLTGKLKQGLLRFISDRFLFAEPMKVLNDILKEHGLSAEGSNIFDFHIRKSTMVWQSGTPGFEYKRSDMSKHIHYVGPLLPFSSKKSGTPWFSEKLKKYKKVVLLTQGTVETDVDKLLAPTLEALRNTDFLLIVTTGGSRTEELKEKYAAENILIEDFIPFDEVMPYADVYVTNGGYGGVLLSIKHQLPMVVAGVHEGKNEINARIGYFGLGINLKTEKPAPSQIRAAVEKVVNDSSYADKVTNLSHEFSQYDTNHLCAEHIASLLEPRVKLVRMEEAEIY